MVRKYKKWAEIPEEGKVDVLDQFNEGTISVEVAVSRLGVSPVTFYRKRKGKNSLSVGRPQRSGKGVGANTGQFGADLDNSRQPDIQDRLVGKRTIEGKISDTFGSPFLLSKFLTRTVIALELPNGKFREFSKSCGNE